MLETEDDEPTVRQKMRSLLERLRAAGLDEYGSYIPAEFVQAAMRIQVPEVATRETFNRIGLIEMAAVDYCRAALLNEGKYLSGCKGGYRVLLPSENKSQVDAYISSADNKLCRALKLSKNTPKEVGIAHDQTEARILLKQHGMRRGGDQPGMMM